MQYKPHVFIKTGAAAAGTSRAFQLSYFFGIGTLGQEFAHIIAPTVGTIFQQEHYPPFRVGPRTVYVIASAIL